MTRDERRRLLWVRRATEMLSLPFPKQAAYLRSFGMTGAVDELALEFSDEAYVLTPALRDEGVVSDNLADALASIDRALDRMSPGLPVLWTEEGLRAAAEWANIRGLATTALDLFPDTVEFLRADLDELNGLVRWTLADLSWYWLGYGLDLEFRWIDDAGVRGYLREELSQEKLVLRFLGIRSINLAGHIAQSWIEGSRRGFGEVASVTANPADQGVQLLIHWTEDRKMSVEADTYQLQEPTL